MESRDWQALAAAIVLALFIGLYASGSPFHLLTSNESGTVASTTAPSGIASGTEALIASPAGTRKNNHATSTATTTPATHISGDMTLALAKLRSALVNITCDVHEPRGTFLVSGSGVIIDSRGVILTNSHVAQFMLLSGSPESASCVIRVGSPAATAYYGKLMYMPEAWVRKFPGTALSGAPSATGEDDFALVAITASATSFPLPPSFPSVPLSQAVAATGDQTGLGSYGAQGLDFGQVKLSLNPTLASARVQDFFAFNGSSDPKKADLIVFGGNPVAQSGSSGGGIVNAESELVGLIVASRPGISLRALTTPYVLRAFQQGTGTSLPDYLASGDPKSLAQGFTDTGAKFSGILEKGVSR